MARTTANQREDPGQDNSLSPQETINCLMRWFDGIRSMRIMAIARQYGEKAEAIEDGIVFVRPAGDRYTIEVSRRARQ